MSFDTGGREKLDVSTELGKKLRITVAANQGGRRYMEDRVHVEVVYTPDGQVDYTYLSVYDGHGGAEASQFTKQHLLKNIQKQIEFDSTDDDEFLEAIRKGFLKTHYAMKAVVDDWPRTASGYPSTAGTTASVAFIRRGKIYTGHVGDSAIVLGRKVRRSNGERDAASLVMQSCRLTVDHKPENIEEEERIRACGGEVLCKNGVMRVVWERPLRGHFGPIRRNTPTERIPFLAVARSLGDLWSWNEESQKYCVSPDPDLDVHVIDKDDVCIIIASDGLTNVMTPLLSTVVVDMCEQFTEENTDTDMRLHRPAHKNHARMLLKQALASWRNLRADNISVIAVVLDGDSTRHIEHAPCLVEKLKKEQSLDEKLTKCPEAMIYVNSQSTAHLKTEYVPIIYQGALDSNADCLQFSGPGFVSHSDEMLREADVDAQLEEIATTDQFDLFGDPPPFPVFKESNEKGKTENKKINETKVIVTPPSKPVEAAPRITRSTKRSRTGSGTPPQANNSTSVKKHLKYFCKDHGVECDKAKKANEVYEAKKRAAEANKCNVVERDDLEGTDEEETISHSDSAESSFSSAFCTPTKKDRETGNTHEIKSDNGNMKTKCSPRVTRSSKRAPKTPITHPMTVRASTTCRPIRTPKRRLNSSSSTPNQSEERENGSIELNIIVEQDTTGVVTRSRDRSVCSTSTMVTLSLRSKSKTPETEEKELPQGFYTPASRLVMSEESRRSSRKRPRLPSPSGVTPLVGRVALLTPKRPHRCDGIERSLEIQEMEGECENEKLENPVQTISRSEPTTPVKSPTFVYRLPPSRWSLGKLEPSVRGEPPTNKSKGVWGFIKRLVGVTDSE